MSHISRLFPILAVGVLAVSLSSIFSRLAIHAAGDSSPWFGILTAAGRMFVASLLLLPLWGNLAKSKPTRTAVISAVMAGGFLALHFATWISSLSFTTLAKSVTLGTTGPVWISLFGLLFWRHKITRTEFLGVAIALSGAFIVSASQSNNWAPNPNLGNLLAIIGAMCAGMYFLFGRQAQHQGLSATSYITVAYTVSAVLLIPLVFLLPVNLGAYSFQVFGWIALTGVVSQMIGHTSFNYAMRFVSPVVVSLIILLEPIGASIFGYFIFGEIPGVQVLLGALVIIFGVGITLMNSSDNSEISPVKIEA